MENEILQRLNAVEQRYKKLKRMAVGITCLLFLALTSMGFTRKESVNVLRAKGIVIEDEFGRDRILIGAPVPYSKNRVRTDTTLVRKFWASKFGNANQYMQWYKEYKNSANGIVFMNEKGFDVVQVGDDLSDPNVGKRMFRSTGIIWNTQTGFERGGAGVNTTDDGVARPTIGLDDDSGEAMHMICLEDGSKAIIIGDENGSLRIGMASKGSELFQNKTKFVGVKYINSNGETVWEKNITEISKTEKN